MKIELKNIHHSRQLSRETEAFTANLYINGYHAGYAENDGHGGATHYTHKDERGRELIREAEAYCKTLPPKDYPAHDNMEAFSVDMDLENYVDDLLSKHLEKKEQIRFEAKLKAAMEKGVVYGVPGDYFMGVSYSMPLAQVLAHPKGPEVIHKTIVEKVLPKLGDGKILNTNIPEHILLNAGVKEGQYVKPDSAVDGLAIKSDGIDNHHDTRTGRKR